MYKWVVLGHLAFLTLLYVSNNAATEEEEKWPRGGAVVPPLCLPQEQSAHDQSGEGENRPERT